MNKKRKGTFARRGKNVRRDIRGKQKRRVVTNQPAAFIFLKAFSNESISTVGQKVKINVAYQKR
jgi:hypothetical protein